MSNIDEIQETPEPSDILNEAAQVVLPEVDLVMEEVPEVPVTPVIEKAKIDSPKQNVTQSEETFAPLDENYKGEFLYVPPHFAEIVAERLGDLPNLALDDNDKTRAWANILAKGGSIGTFNAVYKDTLENKDAHFVQSIAAPSGGLHAGSPKFKATENETFKGERAVLRLRSHIGLGALFRVPLWNSGFWITFKSPSEGELLELHRQIISDKISLGRSTYGLAFSNTSSYMMDRLLAFAFSNIYQTNVKTADIDNIRDLVSSHDIPSIIWGVACAIWPNGFKYERSCVNDPEKCQHVISERLNLSKLQWTNTAGLTQWQINHMVSTQPNSIDKESILRYQKEILQAQQRELVINKDSPGKISVILKVPTATEYIQSGNRWVSNIVENVTRALGMNANQDTRDNYIVDQGRTTAMRQYIHWVQSINFSSNNVEDVETLESIFDSLSSDDVVRGEFMDGIEKYINDTALTVIGIPSFDCPMCGKKHEGGLPKHTNVIPIDVYQTFFILLVQRMQRIRLR